MSDTADIQSCARFFSSRANISARSNPDGGRRRVETGRVVLQHVQRTRNCRRLEHRRAPAAAEDLHGHRRRVRHLFGHRAIRRLVRATDQVGEQQPLAVRTGLLERHHRRPKGCAPVRRRDQNRPNIVHVSANASCTVFRAGLWSSSKGRGGRYHFLPFRAKQFYFI